MLRQNRKASQCFNKRKRFPNGHLNRHAHLTNCIHLRYIWHSQRANMKLELGENYSEISLMKELAALKKSRSLRDPLMSPSWKSRGARSNLRTSDNGAAKGKHRKLPVSDKDYTSTSQRSTELPKMEEWIEYGSRLEGWSISQTEPSQPSHTAKKYDTKKYWSSHDLNISDKASRAQACYKHAVTHGGSEGKISEIAFNSESTTQRSHKSRKSIGKVRGSKHRRPGQKVSSAVRDLTFALSTTAINDCTSLQSSALLDDGSINPSGDDHNELEISDLHQDVCKLPWNWSRLHGGSKAIKDLAVKTSWTYRKQSTSSESAHLMTSDTPSSQSYPLLDAGPLSDNASQPGPWFHEARKKDQSVLSGSFPKRTQRKYSYNHQSISQKYAPTSFEEITGQHLVTQTLSNALINDRIAPMYIFYGPAGTGKSSCARVFAHAVNCLAVTRTRPCGTCVKCISQKTSGVKEFGAGGDKEMTVIKALMHELGQSFSSRYQVYILDECHQLSIQAWNAFLKVSEAAPRGVVFILITHSIEQLPYAVLSRCQKFLFSKIKENDIIKRLHLISIQETLEVDPEALKLIASTCDGSLRHSEMMLDQLSLLNEKISLGLVQELMGMVSDEELVVLLDFALSADTKKTVRHLKKLTSSGIEPLNLMSQLACIITNILAGCCRVPLCAPRRKFFRTRELTKENMERLRQALKVLLEAEKQQQSSFDRITWLTAAVLQFAPDQAYVLSNSFTNTSVTQSPTQPTEASRMQDNNHQMNDDCSKPQNVTTMAPSSHFAVQERPKTRRGREERRKHEKGESSSTSHPKYIALQRSFADDTLDDLWQRVLDAVHSNSLRKFLQTEGKLLSLSLQTDVALALIEFSDAENVSRAKRSRQSIAHAFQVTTGFPVDIEVHLATKEVEHEQRQSVSISKGLVVPGVDNSTTEHRKAPMRSNSGPLELYQRHLTRSLHRQRSTCRKSIDIMACEPTTSNQGSMTMKDIAPQDIMLEKAWMQGSPTANCPAVALSASIKDAAHSNAIELDKSETGARNSMSLGLVLHQAEGSIEGCSQGPHFDNVHTRSSQKICQDRGSNASDHFGLAAELEEENLRLESRSGGLLCWSTSQTGHEKVRRQGLLLSLCSSCAKSSS